MINPFRRHQKSTALARLAGLVLLVGALPVAHPACANTLGLTYSAYRLDGHATQPLQQGDFVRSGEKISIKIRYLNQTGDFAPPGAIVLTLPPGCAMVSSNDANSLEISLDGGRHFDPLNRVQMRRGQGAPTARTDALTYIRMTFDHPIAPGEGGVISLIATQG